MLSRRLSAALAALLAGLLIMAAAPAQRAQTTNSGPCILIFICPETSTAPAEEEPTAAPPTATAVPAPTPVPPGTPAACELLLEALKQVQKLVQQNCPGPMCDIYKKELEVTWNQWNAQCGASRNDANAA